MGKRCWRGEIKHLKCFTFWILVKVSCGFILGTLGGILGLYRVPIK